MSSRRVGPLATGSFAAVAAVLLGLVYLSLAGAPPRLMLVNMGALAIGFTLLQLVRSAPRLAAFARGPLLVALAVGLLATTVFGTAIEGATRWVQIAGLSIQPSLMVVPLLVTTHASRPDRWSAAAVAIAVVAAALQPDRSVAGMLFLGTAALLLHRKGRQDALLALLATAGLAVTLIRPDALPAVPFVDQILYTSADVHPLAGVAVWLGTATLFAPVLMFARKRVPAPVLAFASVWAGAVLAAALGNYPTPLVGYGGSIIIGYVLSLMPLQSGQARLAQPASKTLASDGEQDGRTLRFA